MDALQYVHADALLDYSCQQISYYTGHRDTDAPQYVYDDATLDYSAYGMICYINCKNVKTECYAWLAVSSEYSDAKIFHWKYFAEKEENGIVLTCKQVQS
jgi:hypothetical protein